MQYSMPKKLFRVLLPLFVLLQAPSVPEAGEMEIFTGNGTMPGFPERQPENWLAKCMANPDDRISCYMAKTNKTDGGLESAVPGQLEISTFRVCPGNPGGVCLDKQGVDDFSAPKKPPVTGSVLKTVSIKIQFRYKEYSLETGEYKKILQIATAFNHPANRAARFVVIGHTDSKGGERYNCHLSGQRAKSVQSALKEFGVAPERLLFFGVGERYLADSNNGLAAKNRRVDFVRLTGAEGAVVTRMKRICKTTRKHSRRSHR